jgi:adenosylcobinamide-phosphate synthase
MLLYPDALLVLLLALVLDPLLGELRWLWRLVPHPVAIVGAATAWLDRRLNRPERNDRARLMRGIVTVALLIVAAAAMGVLIAWWLRRFYRFGWAIEGVMVALLLAQRSLFAHVARVAAALTESLDAGRAAVAHIVGRDPASLDAHGVARAAIESLAENFSDGVVAPALWYAFFGLPGLFLYKTANTLDSMIGHRSPRHLRFGWAAARLDDLLNFLPARLAGLLIALAALTLPAASGKAALGTMLRDAKKHRSPNAGWPEAAAAGALGLALAGPRRYEGRVVDDPWLGDGRARANATDIAQALRLYVVACLTLALVVFAALMISHFL